MRAIVTKTVAVTLELSKAEADWLHGIMQNPLHGQSLSTESQEDSEMRLKFFQATHYDNTIS